MSGSMQLSLWAVATVLFVASALLPTTTAAPDQYIQIAGLITASNLTQSVAGNYATALAESSALKRGWKMWQEEVNARGIRVGNVTYGVNVTTFDIGGIYGVTYNRTFKVARGDFGNYDFIFGPWGSDFSQAASVAARAFDKVLITGLASGLSVFVCANADGVTCTSKGERISQNTFASVPTAEENYAAGINLLVIEGARSIAIVSENGSFQQSARASAQKAALDYGLNVLMDDIVPTNANLSVATDLVDKLAALNPDILFSSQFIIGTSNVVRAMRARNYTPKSAILRLFGQAVPQDVKPDINYFLDVSSFDERLRGTDYISDLYFVGSSSLWNATDPAPIKLARAVRAKFPTVVSVNSEPIAFLQGEILERAIVRAQSIAPQDVRAAIPLLVFNSIMGRVAFNPFGMNDKTPPVTLQLDREGVLQVISPLGATTTRVVYPIPTWDERREDYSTYSHPSEVGIIIFTCILIAFSVVCAIYVMATWQNKVTKAASPPFLLIVIVGSIFVYSGVLTRPLQTTASMCLATPWLLVGGFVLMYSSIFSRTYRLLRIFNNRSLEIFKVPDFHLYVIVGVLVAIASILLILWTAIVPQQAVLITPDLTRPIQNYYKCASPEGTTVFFGLVGAYMFGIIVAGGVMAIMIWNIRYEVYNESKQLGFAIYNLLFFFVLAIVVSSVFDEDQREISFVLRSVCINLGTCITIGALFIPKMVIAAGDKTLKSWGAEMQSSDKTTSTLVPQSVLSGGSASSLPLKRLNSSVAGETTTTQEHVISLKSKVKKLKNRVRELEALLPQPTASKRRTSNSDQDTSSSSSSD